MPNPKASKYDTDTAVHQLPRFRVYYSDQKKTGIEVSLEHLISIRIYQLRIKSNCQEVYLMMIILRISRVSRETVYMRIPLDKVLGNQSLILFIMLVNNSKNRPNHCLSSLKNLRSLYNVTLMK